mmetsp:Transcript_6498/g.9619  ORF Transcript_6498/g.9619 Transcript_6498/m.9619 type:complete len:358 (+) Transcript_6498:104-1177(+)
MSLYDSSKCSTCGKTEEEVTLVACANCKMVRYCDRHCQKNHWKEHKPNCTSPEKKYEENLKARKRAQKLAKKGAPIVTISYTHAGLVAPGMPIPDGVPENFGYKQKAVTDFHMMARVDNPKNKLGNLKGEQSYKDYYDDIVSSEEEWMSFFNHKENSEHAEHTCGILGTLATIYRQRGVSGQCEEVLDMEVKVLDIYRRHSVGGPLIQIQCYEGLKFKCENIRFNLYQQQHRYEECVSLFKSCALYEYHQDVPSDQQSYLFLVEFVLRKRKISKKVLEGLSHDEIMKIMTFTHEAVVQNNRSRKSQYDVELKKCARCGVEEKAIRTHKKCARCDNTFYCGKTCQKDHWKVHKKECGK